MPPRQQNSGQQGQFGNQPHQSQQGGGPGGQFQGGGPYQGGNPYQPQQGGWSGSGTATQVRQQQLQQVTWEQISEPGLYVDVQTGDLFRIPIEALSGGQGTVMQKVSHNQQILVKLSQEPYLPVSQARALCADADIHPNF